MRIINIYISQHDAVSFIYLFILRRNTAVHNHVDYDRLTRPRYRPRRSYESLLSFLAPNLHKEKVAF